MKDWWFSLQSRERRTLALGGGALLLILLYVGLWEPFQQRHAALTARVAEQQQTIAWMEQAAAQVEQLRGQGARPVADRGGQSLMTLLDSSARSSGLADSLKRVQPESDDSVRVWLEGVSFDGMLGWLDQLIARQGVVVDSLVVERGKAEGRVDVRAVMRDAK